MEAAVVRVLVVEDNPGDARLVEWALAHEPDGTFQTARADRVAAALEHLGRSPVDAVLLDLGLPDSQGMDGLRRILEKAPDVAVVVLTGSEDPARVRAAIAAGAQDYQVKGIFPRGHLSRVLGLATHRQRLEGRLRDDQVPETVLLSESSRRGDGVAILAPGRPMVVNEELLRLTGIAGDHLDKVPAWFSKLVREPLGSSPPAGSRTTEPPTEEVAVGGLEIEGAGGRRTELEYVVRRFSAGVVPRTMIRLRDRSAPHLEGAPATRDAGQFVLAESAATVRGPFPETGPGGVTVLDAAAWAQLRELAGHDPTFLPSLLAAFLEEGRRLVRGMEVAAEQGDTAALVHCAHSLKSGLAQVGALALSRRCADLERGGAEGNLPEIRIAVRDIARDFPAVVRALAEVRLEP